MPRLPRIELPGAVYFVTSKAGEGLEPWADSANCQMFLDLLDELCQRVDWEVHAFALLPDRYHLLVRTHKPNLSLGMKWLQGSFSKAARSAQSNKGPLLEGRYKACPVQDNADPPGYLIECADYLHLLPEKEELLEPWEPLDSSRWNSIAYFTARRMDCPRWLNPAPVFEQADIPYSYFGRVRYLRQLETRVASWSTPAGKKAEAARTAKFQRGWYIGDKNYGNTLKKALENRADGPSLTSTLRGSQEQEERRANEILQDQLKHLSITPQQLTEMSKNAPLKIALATLIRENTMVSNQWLSETLQMGHPSRVSRYTRGELSGRLAARVAEDRAQLLELQEL